MKEIEKKKIENLVVVNKIKKRNLSPPFFFFEIFRFVSWKKEKKEKKIINMAETEKSKKPSSPIFFLIH